LLQAIADLSEDALRQGLTALQAAEFLYETHLFPDLEYTFKHALTHEVAYGSLLQKRQRELHRRIAEAIENVYAARLAEQLERLAHHYTEAGLAEPAITYWQQAGQRASERSANLEAIAHLTKALELLEALPHTAERDQRELSLQIALGVPLQNVRGAGAPEVGHAYTRARDLCQRAGENREHFTVLWGLWRYYRQGSEFQKARELTEGLFSLAHTENDQALLLQAHHAHWTTKLFLGDFVSALESSERGVGLYDIEEHRGQAFLFAGHDPAVCGLGTGALALWLLGYPEQAVRKTHKALALARDLDHPATLVLALSEAAEIYQLRGEQHLVQEHTAAILPITIEQGFTDKLATGTFMHGWARTAQGLEEDGVKEMERGVSQRGRWGELEEPLYVALMVEAYRRQDRFEEGLRALTEAFTTAEKSGLRYWDAELYRLKGELSLARSNQAEAEDCCRRAIAIAQQQSAKSLELRAAMSLTKLWSAQGRLGEAQDLLAPVYDWFTEGFDTADLRDAKALLDEIA
jgi:predicted ATPase